MTIINRVDLRLPVNQPIIQTSNVQKIHQYIAKLSSTSTDGQPSMGVIVGQGGIGKTVAVIESLRELDAQALLIECNPSLTPTGFANDLLVALGEEPGSRRLSSLSQQLIQLIRDTGIQIIAIDEASFLSARTLDFVSDLHGEAHIPLLMISVTSLRSSIAKHHYLIESLDEEFAAESISFEEVVHTFLPSLAVPLWHMEPDAIESVEICQLIWERAGHSLRRMHALATVASHIAVRENASRVALAHVLRAIELSGDTRKP
jgi:hypothetical protein